MTKKRSPRTNRKKPKRDSKTPHRKNQVLTRVPRGREEIRTNIDPLLGDLPSVTLKNEREVFFHFKRIDPRLAEAWRRDVVVHEGPITLRRVMSPASFDGATHYAYVDRRLLWYLKHDPSDPLGACWNGYLINAGDAPSGTIAVFVGRNIVAKKQPPLLEEGNRR